MSSEPITDIRQWLREQLLDEVPEGWDIKPGLRQKDAKLAKTTVYIEYTTIDASSTPPGSAIAGIDLVVASKFEDRGKGENDVDGAVLDLILALDKIIDAHANLSWRAEPATKEELDGSANLCWRIRLNAVASLTKPEPKPEPEPDDEPADPETPEE